MRGYNDDLVLAAAIASWVRETVLVSNRQDAEYKKAMINCLYKTNTSLNTKIQGMKGYKKSANYNKKLTKDSTLNIDKVPFFTG